MAGKKLEAEKKVLSVSDENIVVLRITLLNGNSPQGNRSPHERILGALRKNAPVVLFDDEYRQPCSTHEVASVILELLERPNLNGLFHWAGSELITRYELGLRILKKFGFDHKKITRASIESEVERVGNRPACLAFELQPLRGKLKTEPESIESQLSSLQVPASLYSWFRENVDYPGVYVLAFEFYNECAMFFFKMRIGCQEHGHRLVVVRKRQGSQLSTLPVETGRN